ncbi:hypothetical protein ACN20G_08915 [Streptomyces sp. BI20]|uniref:hypothetical protein n=1 Tax=Streptomyces sp. BI20 TaxID=3403460 RepID=UPI003C70E9AB
MTERQVRRTAEHVLSAGSEDVDAPSRRPPRGAGEGGSRTRSGASASGSGRAEEAARRRAERREERIDAGARELERRLADLVREGLAGRAAERPGDWAGTAARMVDAQAPGLAARVRDLGALPVSEPGRLLAECATAHLLARAWLGREALPPALAAVVRARVGLPAPAVGPAVRDLWSVLSQRDLPSLDGRLTTRRIWLHGHNTGDSVLLLDFGGGGRLPALTLPVGFRIDAEVRRRPGADGPRADLGERFGEPDVDPSVPTGVSTEEALDAYGSALRRDPWLDSVPVVLGPVIPVPTPLGWHVRDADGAHALPVTGAGGRPRPGLWRLAAVSGGAPVTVFGECGHRGLTPLTVWDPVTGEPTPLT